MDWNTGSIEFLIGGFFLLLFFVTFVPSIILIVLELLQVVHGRHDPAMDLRTRQAEVLLAQPGVRRRLRRFTVHQRAQHAVLLVMFVVLAVTGFSLKFPDAFWTRPVFAGLDGPRTVRTIHVVAGEILLLVFLYHLVYLAGCVAIEKRRKRKSLGRVLLDSPIMPNAGDIRHQLSLAACRLGLRSSPAAGGRFSPSEKFDYLGAFWGIIVLGLTGLILGTGLSRYLSARAMTVLLLVHSLEALLAVLHVGIIHIYKVIFAPSVVPGSPAMLTGTTPVAKLAESHAGWLSQNQSQPSIPEEAPRHAASSR